jgi:hypothetical protein
LSLWQGASNFVRLMTRVRFLGATDAQRRSVLEDAPARGEQGLFA